MNAVTFFLALLCGALAGIVVYLVNRIREFDRQLDSFGDAISKLALKAAETAKVEERVEDHVTERLAKRMDDGFQKIMAWNPFDTDIGGGDGN